MSKLRNIWKKFLVKYILEDPSTCEHEWMVYSTAINQGCLELQCTKCALVGSVNDPTEDEWERAYYADEGPYPWKEIDRVEVGTYQMI